MSPFGNDIVVKDKEDTANKDSGFNDTPNIGFILEDVENFVKNL